MGALADGLPHLRMVVRIRPQELQDPLSHAETQNTALAGQTLTIQLPSNMHGQPAQKVVPMQHTGETEMAEHCHGTGGHSSTAACMLTATDYW